MIDGVCLACPVKWIAQHSFSARHRSPSPTLICSPPTSFPLQALFRPMAMMIPDYALVAEVMLFSEGFEDSKTLSRKMVKLYKLCSEQLSQQVCVCGCSS